MSRRCELTGKGVLVGNNVSHANNKTRRRFLPNLNSVTLISDTLRQSVRVRVDSLPELVLPAEERRSRHRQVRPRQRSQRRERRLAELEEALRSFTHDVGEAQ